MGRKKISKPEKIDIAEKKAQIKREQLSKICFFAVSLFFSFFILIVFTDYTNITAVKYNTFLILTVALALMYSFEKGSMLLEGQVCFKTKRADCLPYIFVGGFLGFNCLSALFSPLVGTLNNKGQSMLLFGDKRYDGLLVIFFYIILFLIFSLEKSFHKSFTYVVTVTIGIATVVGIIQLFGVNVLNFFPPSDSVNNYYVLTSFISTIGNIDMVSAIYCILLPIVAFSYIAFKTKAFFKVLQLVVYLLAVFMFWEINVDSGKIAFVAVHIIALNVLFFKREWYLKFLNITIVSSIGIILSRFIIFTFNMSTNKLYLYTRFDIGCIIWLSGSILAMIFAFIYKCFIQDKILKPIFICIICAEVLAFLAFLYWMLNFADSSHSALYEFAEILKGRGKDTFGSYRYALWKNTLELANERFLIGYGTGTFRIAFAEYATDFEGSLRKVSYDFAHNEFLQIYYNSGIFGLISYLGFIGTLIFTGIKNCFKNERVMILTFTMICFLVQSFFMFSIIIVSPLFWIVAGMLCYEVRNTTINA